MWPLWSKLIWVGILLALFVYELIGVLEGRQFGVPTLTRLTVRYVPGWITLSFLIWLLIHFILRYWKK